MLVHLGDELSFLWVPLPNCQASQSYLGTHTWGGWKVSVDQDSEWCIQTWGPHSSPSWCIAGVWWKTAPMDVWHGLRTQEHCRSSLLATHSNHPPNVLYFVHEPDEKWWVSCRLHLTLNLHCYGNPQKRTDWASSDGKDSFGAVFSLSHCPWDVHKGTSYLHDKGEKEQKEKWLQEMLL